MTLKTFSEYRTFAEQKGVYPTFSTALAAELTKAHAGGELPQAVTVTELEQATDPNLLAAAGVAAACRKALIAVLPAADLKEVDGLEDTTTH